MRTKIFGGTGIRAPVLHVYAIFSQSRKLFIASFVIVHQWSNTTGQLLFLCVAYAITYNLKNPNDDRRGAPAMPKQGKEIWLRLKRCALPYFFFFVGALTSAFPAVRCIAFTQYLHSARQIWKKMGHHLLYNYLCRWYCHANCSVTYTPVCCQSLSCRHRSWW